MSNVINRWVRPQIRELSAYHASDQGQYIKLDAMENPYPWDQLMTQAWLETLREISLNRYPDGAARETVLALRRVMNVPDNMAVILGNGSDELIQMAALTVSGPGHTIIAPEPSFVMYRHLAHVCGLRYIGVPLRADDFGLDLQAMLSTIETHQPALVFLAYPNNPTGGLFERSAMEAIIRASPGLVVVDEAYFAFTDSSFMADLGRYPNLLVMRTVSKIGLAGIRLGLLAGPKAWLEEIEKTRLPYNINVLTQASAVFALRQYSVLAQQTRQIRADRQDLLAALQGMPKVHAWPSQANFILFRVRHAPEVFAGLKQHGILIKCLHGAHPLLTDCLRVTVGTPEENQTFVKALRQVV
jgi:histidinol-phosphate aminotransferase